MKFKVGDRVACFGLIKVHGGPTQVEYDNDKPLRVSIRHDLGKGWFVASQAPDTIPFQVHEKQCRKLVKKERRRVWVNEKATVMVDSGRDLVMINNVSYNKLDGWTEFIEVKK